MRNLAQTSSIGCFDALHLLYLKDPYSRAVKIRKANSIYNDNYKLAQEHFYRTGYRNYKEFQLALRKSMSPEEYDYLRDLMKDGLEISMRTPREIRDQLSKGEFLNQHTVNSSRGTLDRST